MADPVLTVQRNPMTREVAEHPLATQAGLAMMLHLFEADKVWSGCTKPQRALLSELCPPVVEKLLEQGELGVERMPYLPDSVRAATRAALHRRGLADEEGRLTGKAVHAWFYTSQFGERGKTNGGGHG